MGMIKKLRSPDGQMTVELAVVFPVCIVITLIVVNALLFFSECAAFDNAFRDAVRVHATLPAYGQELEQDKAQIVSQLNEEFDHDYVSANVAVESVADGYVTFQGTLEFSPTLFGLGFKSSVFGASLPRLQHVVSYTVDRYKPGVLL